MMKRIMVCLLCLCMLTLSVGCDSEAANGDAASTRETVGEPTSTTASSDEGSPDSADRVIDENYRSDLVFASTQEVYTNYWGEDGDCVVYSCYDRGMNVAEDQKVAYLIQITYPDDPTFGEAPDRLENEKEVEYLLRCMANVESYLKEQGFEVLEDHRLHYTGLSTLSLGDPSAFKLFTDHVVLVALTLQEYGDLVGCIPSPDQASTIATHPFLCIAPIDRLTVAPYVTDANG